MIVEAEVAPEKNVGLGLEEGEDDAVLRHRKIVGGEDDVARAADLDGRRSLGLGYREPERRRQVGMVHRCEITGPQSDLERGGGILSGQRGDGAEPESDDADDSGGELLHEIGA